MWKKLFLSWFSPELQFESALHALNWERLEYLVEKNPQVALNWRGEDVFSKQSISALSLSVRVGLPRLTQMLLEIGANLKERDKEGNTLLHLLAMRVGRDEDFGGQSYVRCVEVIAKHLEKKNINALDSGVLNQCNAQGFTALGLCAKGYQKSLCECNVKAAQAQESLLLHLSKLGESPMEGGVGCRACEYLPENILLRSLAESEGHVLGQVCLSPYGKLKVLQDQRTLRL